MILYSNEIWHCINKNGSTVCAKNNAERSTSILLWQISVWPEFLVNYSKKKKEKNKEKKKEKYSYEFQQKFRTNQEQ